MLIRRDMRNKPRDTAAVVVTYRPRLSQLKNLCSLAAQLHTVFVVDNTSGRESAGYFRRAAELANVRVLRLGTNLGIAAALNIGMRAACDSGFAWAITLDQDSYFPLGATHRLRRARTSDTIAIMAPAIRDAFTRKLVLGSPAHARIKVRRKAVITSGNLVRLSAWAAVGGFDPQLFLDLVDYDFCLRLGAEGWVIQQVGAVQLLHHWGRVRQVSWLGRVVSLRTYPPLRRYLQARNSIVLLRRHGASAPLWSLTQLCGLITVSIKILILERGSLKAWWKGLRDGRQRWGRKPVPGTNLLARSTNPRLGQTYRKRLEELSAFPELRNP